jgi:uncharacterized membrane protein YcgQ (UPF0703/DUF1980 family)
VTFNPVLATLIVVAVWFLIFVCLHIVGLRSRQGNAQWLIRSYAACCTATLVTVVALSMWRDSGQTLLLLLFLALLTSACLFVLYVPAVYTILTSLSVATLIVLRRTGGCMPETSLYDRFATREIIQQRLCVLVGAGYLAENACGFSLTSRGRGLALAFAFIKRLWCLGPGG